MLISSIPFTYKFIVITENHWDMFISIKKAPNDNLAFIQLSPSHKYILAEIFIFHVNGEMTDLWFCEEQSLN